MTTINGNRPTFNLGPASRPGPSLAQPAQSFVADDLSSYVKDGKLTDFAIEQFKAQSPEEQQRLLQKFATAAKVSGKAQDAQVVVDLYLALVDAPGGAAAAGRLGPGINQLMAGLVPLADAADRTRGRSPELEAAITKMRSSRLSFEDTRLLVASGSLAQMTPEEKGLLLNRLSADRSSNVAQSVSDINDVIASAKTAEDYARMMAVAGDGDANVGRTRMEQAGDLITDRDLRAAYQRTFARVTQTANSLPSVPIPSLRAASVANAAGAAAAGTANGAPASSTDQVTNGMSAEEQRKQDAQKALQDEIAASAGAYDRTYTKASADGKLSLSEQYELMSAAGDPSNLVERFMAGDPTAMKLAGSEQGMMYIKELMSRRNSMRDTFNGLLDDENSRRKKMAQSVGQG